MAVRVPVAKAVVDWAVARAPDVGERARVEAADWELWLDGKLHPTLDELQDFARATRTPIGFFFLKEAPKVDLPIADFRTGSSVTKGAPSPDLLETIYVCQQRQEWYRSYARSLGLEPVAWVGSMTVRDDVVAGAATIARAIEFSVPARARMRSWDDALRTMQDGADAAGVLVMTNGIVGLNTSRRLDIDEFRGFALSDPIAPLVFVNGADTLSGKMFTLAHELAHLALGATALSDASVLGTNPRETERWCDKVAAELLVPMEAFGEQFDRSANRDTEMQRLARWFKVSTLVILRRMHEVGAMSRTELNNAYAIERDRLSAIMAMRKAKQTSGGDFYSSTSRRLSPRFEQAVTVAAFEGRTTFTEAMRLTGVRKVSTLREIALRAGVMIDA